jgi:putative transposase
MSQRQGYPSDLTDAEWERLAPLIPPAKPGGRPRGVAPRAVLNGIRYVLRGGIPWRMLPRDLPPWETVYGYFRRWQRDGTWEQLNAAPRREVRVAAGRQPEPSAGSLDSQSVKTTERGGTRGYDAGKKVNGRKRHILVDTLGLLLLVVVHAASVQDRDGAKLVLEAAVPKCPRLRKIWADGGYAGQLIGWVAALAGWVLEIVKRPDDARGFVGPPRRRTVERTFGWLGRYRRLSKDDEALTEVSEAMIYAAMCQLMLRRLARKQAS